MDARAIGDNSTEIANSCLITVWTVVDWKKKVLLLFILKGTSTQNNREDTNNHALPIISRQLD